MVRAASIELAFAAFYPEKPGPEPALYALLWSGRAP